MTNYYEVLGISENASLSEIKEKYKKLMRDNHPDKFKDPAKKAKAEELCKTFGEAYNNLNNSKDRRKHDEDLKEERKRTDPVITISKNFFDLGELQYNEKKQISFMVDYLGQATSSFEIVWLNPISSWASLDYKPTPKKGYPLEVIVTVQPDYNLIENITYTNTLQITIAKKSYNIVVKFRLKAKQVKISKDHFDLGILKAGEKKQVSFTINYPANTCNAIWKNTEPVWGKLSLKGKGLSTSVTVDVCCKDYLTDGLQESVIKVTVKNKSYDINIKFISNHEPKIEFSDLELDFGRLPK